MIALLRGTTRKGKPGEILVDVNGVGYAVATPLPVWDECKEGEEIELQICTYVREDRLELFGFIDPASKALFESAIMLSGVGPKLALEICSVPQNLLLAAIDQQDVKLLTSIKGVGKKTAEKLLVDLRDLVEKHPDIFSRARSDTAAPGAFDEDAIAALSSLGYDTPTIMRALKNLPEEVETSEERVAAALRSL